MLPSHPRTVTVVGSTPLAGAQKWEKLEIWFNLKNKSVIQWEGLLGYKKKPLIWINVCREHIKSIENTKRYLKNILGRSKS